MPELDEREVIEGLQRLMAGASSPEEAVVLREQVDALFEAHQSRVYAVCLRFLGDPERAREIAQDALLIAYRKLPEFRNEASFGTWLYSICRNLAWRDLAKRRETLFDDWPELTDPTPSPLADLRRAERIQLVRDAARSVLDPVEQEAIELRWVQNLPVDRITALLDLRTATGARGLLQRCRHKMRRELLRLMEERQLGSSFARGTVTG